MKDLGEKNTKLSLLFKCFSALILKFDQKLELDLEVPHYVTLIKIFLLAFFL